MSVPAVTLESVPVVTISRPSKNRINIAGARLRDWFEMKLDLTDDELLEETAVVTYFRKQHSYPLQMVAANLRHFVAKVDGGKPVIAQRLKRLPTIVDKLVREPGMNLSRMHDIAGCRAVLPTVAQVDAVADGLNRQKRWDVVRHYDYIRRPKPDGYRARHLVVRKRGQLVEVQLRTSLQHSWAELIERADRELGLKLKGGEGPADLREYYRLGGSLLAAEERGETPDPENLEKFRALHERVSRNYFSGRKKS